jgi:hypothetical protein
MKLSPLPLPPVAVFLALLLPSLAAAQSRPDSLRLSCPEVRALVLRQGSVVLGTGPYVYERYVSGPAQCPVTDGTQRSFVQTRDSAQCYVGERCVPRQHYLTPGR